jgi:hypothetical protein
MGKAVRSWYLSTATSTQYQRNSAQAQACSKQDKTQHDPMLYPAALPKPLPIQPAKILRRVIPRHILHSQAPSHAERIAVNEEHVDLAVDLEANTITAKTRIGSKNQLTPNGS